MISSDVVAAFNWKRDVPWACPKGEATGLLDDGNVAALLLKPAETGANPEAELEEDMRNKLDRVECSNFIVSKYLFSCTTTPLKSHDDVLRSEN